MRYRQVSPVLIGAFAFVSMCVDKAWPQSCSIERVSVDQNGSEVPYASVSPSLGNDGRYVLFSTQSALLPGDTNYPVIDAYLVDLRTNQAELLSISPSGAAGNGNTSFAGSISEDSRYVAFTSGASDLVAGDTGDSDAFVRDRLLGATVLVSTTASGANGDAVGHVKLSPDARFLVFTSSKKLVPYDTNGILKDVYVRDLQLGTVECVTVTAAGISGPGPGDANYGLPVGISSDGRYVVFSSAAQSLVPGDVQNFADVFRRDRWTGTTLAVSASSAGQLGNDHSLWAACSEDGRYVAFQSLASNLVPGDTNGKDDVFVCDLQAGAIERVSSSVFGTECLDGSHGPALSPDGRFVVFSSACTDLVANDTNNLVDVFFHDRWAHRTERVLSVTLGEPNGPSTWPVISRNAGVIAFASDADNMISLDTNSEWDVFVRRCPLPIGYCTAKVNSQGCLPTMDSSGIPMVVTPTGFVLAASQVLNQKTGMLFYSTVGATSVPFQGGTLCVQAPLRRTTAQTSGGSQAGTDCTGIYALDFNAWIASSVDPALTAGASVWTQYWSRDPGFPAPNSSGLTNATSFVIWP